MTQVTKALLWAAAIIVFAITAASGMVESETAITMMIILPALAWATIGGRPSLWCPSGNCKGHG